MQHRSACQDQTSLKAVKQGHLFLLRAVHSPTVKIKVGHTPDADDAFMFYGMLTGGIPSPGFEVEHVVEDIETLNKKASSPRLDVTAVSVHACAYLPEYTILRSGGSFGLGYGPIIITSEENSSIEDVAGRTVAIPGRLTSAFLLLQIMMSGRVQNVIEMNFAQIPEAVRTGKVDAGLVIHETQLSYSSEGVSKVLDLGEWWDKSTGGLPVPLGVNVMRTDAGTDAIVKFDRYLHDSIRYAKNNEAQALEYAMRYARGKPADMIKKFVRMYVNDTTVDMKKAGERAIRTMFEMALQKGLLKDHTNAGAPAIAPELQV